MKTFTSHLNGFHDVADQLASHLRRRAEVAFAWEANEKAALTTIEAFETRRQRLRASMLNALGGLPDLSADVTETTTGTIIEADMSIEKVLIETLPGVHASANLYLPHLSEGPSPAVLFMCGHAREAKAYPEYQQVCRSLAQSGLVVLALDPIGQGERLQYVNPDTGEQQIEWGTVEHAHVGFQCSLIGSNLARYFIADGMQALSYLQSRPEVDFTRLGITGNSGGGTQASYLMFLDDRYTCGAPFTFITGREAYMATGQPHDSEQNVHNAISMGLNYDDLAGGLAPKPLMLGAVASDFFSIEGTFQTYERLERIYRLYDRSEQLYLTVSPGEHAYSPLLRAQATQFFKRHLLGESVDLASGVTSFASSAESPIEVTPPIEVAEIAVLPAEDLSVTKQGQVALDLPTSKTVFDLNLAKWKTHRERTGARRQDEEESKAHLARAVFGDRPRPPMWVRQVLEGEEGGIRWWQRYTFTEPGIAVSMIELVAEGNTLNAPVTVVATNEGTGAILSRTAWVRDRVRQDGRVLLFDPRGTGAVAQRPINEPALKDLFGTLFKLNYDAMMLGDSLFAMLIFDAVRVLEYAHRIAPSVRVHGEGTFGAILLSATLLDDDIENGVFKRVLGSWDDIITERFYEPDYFFEVFGLCAFPDVRTMAARLPQMTVMDMLDARGQLLERSSV